MVYIHVKHVRYWNKGFEDIVENTLLLAIFGCVCMEQNFRTFKEKLSYVLSFDKGFSFHLFRKVLQSVIRHNRDSLTTLACDFFVWLSLFEIYRLIFQCGR